MHRRTAVAALAASLALTTGACAATDQRTAAPTTLRVAGPFEVHSLEPAADGELFTRLEVTETLVTSDVRGQLSPGLARDWRPSSDRTQWTFDLVEGATFHDGTPVTGEVVAVSLERAAQEPASPLADLDVEGVDSAGQAVTVRLAAPALTLPAVLTHYSTAVLAPGSYGTDGRVRSVIGTGPYAIDEIALPSRVSTTRAKQWRGKAPAVESVQFQAVGRAETRALMAVSGQADVVFGLEPAGRSRVDAADSVRMESSLQPRTLMLKLNADHPALADVRVRRALSLALDRPAMAQAVLREQDLAATQLLPPSLEAWHSTEVAPLRHDVQEARAQLAAAGWAPGADGVVRKDGTKLELTLLTYPDRPELPALATAIQAELAKVGVAVRVDVTNSSEIPAGQKDGSLEMALVAKHFALVSDPLVDIAAVFAPGGSDWGVMNWQDDDMDQAVKALLTGTSEQRGAQARETIVETAQAELPLVPVAWYRMNAAVSDRVDGFVMDPLETTWRISGTSWAR
ncbi:ABC transporter substrate-binding protein [Pedococcus aerophilus]|uniref:ABC transporter substrate-binding protein n=1 Tax=Pedococcus aerophilus TaxID=436356 RepID=A0ABN3UMV9_9MICO